MINITSSIAIPDDELKIRFICAPGPGGQNVNKVATGVQLRFNVIQSPSLPDAVKERLTSLLGQRLTTTGYLVIKATRYRTQLRNKQDAIERLTAWIVKALLPPKKRKKTKPTKASQERRLTQKKQHGKNKALRRNKPEE